MKLPILGNERPDLCGPCGGKCCSVMPGIPHPDDLGAPDVDVLRANVVALLATKRWCVDHDGEWPTDGEPFAWYIRPAITGREPRGVNYGFDNGPCTFLREGRCEIYDERPRGCRVVVPGGTPDKPHCRAPKTEQKVDLVDAWEPYEQLLRDAGYEADRRARGGPT